MGNLRPALNKCVADKAEVMIALRGMPANLGPGVVEKWTDGSPTPAYNVRRQIDDQYTCINVDLGTAERYVAEHTRDGAHQIVEIAPPNTGLYRITSKALVQGKGGQPHEVTVPTIFDSEDVGVIIEVPKNIDNEPLVQTPGGQRSRGGLHIPGRG